MPESVNVRPPTVRGMKQSEALTHLRNMAVAAMKARSVILESHGWDQVSAEDLNPWLFGDGNVLPKLAEILGAGRIDPSGFRNLMWVASKAHLAIHLNGLPPFPESHTLMFASFDPE